MSIFNEKLVEALFGGGYTCSKCGAKMVFESEDEDILVCNACGHSVDLDRYGSEDEEDYLMPFPVPEEWPRENDDEDDW